MSVVLQLTPHDPLIARDGRPFGVGQGNRMRGLPWPLPSVVAGSFRTALVKSNPEWDFSWTKFKQEDLLKIAVAGVFPVHGGELYLPAPNDYVWNEETGERYRARPYDLSNCCDFPAEGLQPVLFSDDFKLKDFKPAEVPAWWPIGKYAEWLLGNEVCFDSSFLRSPLQETRDHVCLDAERGAAAEGQIFATAGLNVTRLPRFGVDGARPLHERLAEITLSGRITIPDSETALTIGQQFGIWHPLGGERRMVHWQQKEAETTGWNCPAGIRSALATATKVRMVLATPAVFKDGWKPGWLTTGLEGDLSGVKLKLVGASNGRWKAVSGWSLADTKDQPRGPKPIRRMVPAGSVYFFVVEKPGDAAPLADLWLQSVSDDQQERRDGFGLALWGTW
jgi:CRISPR-associated protein Cmr3